jgi:phage-related holin
MSILLKAALIATIATLAPVHGTMGAALCLIVLDLITGVLAARKRGDPITSCGLRRTVSKIVVYELGIITGYVIQHYLLADELPVIKLISSAIAMVEATSILENLNTINGSPIFNRILAMLGSKNEEDGK